MTHAALVLVASALALSPAFAQEDAPASDPPQPDQVMTDDSAGSSIGVSRATELGTSGGLHAPKVKKKETTGGQAAGGSGGGGFGSGAGAGVGSGARWSPPDEKGGSCRNYSMEPPISRQPKFHFAEAVIENSPADVASYAVTTSITRLDITRDGFAVDFTKKDGPGRWPDITTPGWDGPLQYTLWMVEAIGGKWYASGPIEYWHGLERSGGGPSQVYENWFYDPRRWGPMGCHQPKVGERVGFLVTHGDARNDGNGSSPLRERSNIVWIEYPGADGGAYGF